MNKIIFPSKAIPLFLLGLMIVISLVSCSQNSSIELVKKETQTLLPKSEKTPEKSHLAKANPADIIVLKEYAESYEPKSTKESVIPSPPNPNEMVLQSISNLENSESQDYEKYIVLIYLRLYRFHIENFKQSYELGRDNPLTKEFFRIIKSNNYQKVDLMPSYLGTCKK